METTNKLFYSGTKFFTENEEDYRITVRISLDDDCKNNICDWSITADVDWKNKHGKYEDYLGGCCHDEVAKHFPELAKFISLHLCNHYGAPMYPVENGIYHVRRSGMSVAMEYLRISEQECAELYKASEDELYFKYMLFNLGIVNRWKRESEELIAELEKMCGKKWVNPYKPEEERFVLTLTDEDDKEWHISLFAREIVDDSDGLSYKYECSNGTLWDCCIPFEGNEYLLETAENPEK